MDDVAPPFAIDGSVPMEDDSCNDTDSDQDHALEEDDIEDGNVEEHELPDRATEEPPKTVDFFA